MSRFAVMRRVDIPDINDPQLTYLTRWVLLRTPWFAIYLHAIRLPDADRHSHDHPWSFVSIVLRGGYVEIRPKNYFEQKRGRRYGGSWTTFADEIATVRKFGSVAFRRAEQLHRISYLIRTPTWTLVFCGPRRRSWGFATEEGWKHHENYFRERGIEMKSTDRDAPIGGDDDSSLASRIGYAVAIILLLALAIWCPVLWGDA